MIKSGLIVGAVSFVLAVVAGAGVSPFCGLCVGLIGGLAAGFVAGVFDKPADSGAGAKSGAGAGAIAAVGALIGLVIAGLINAVVVGPEGAADFMRLLGLPANSDPTTYYLGAIGIPICIGLFNVALMAGLGALGGMLWFQMNGKKNTPPAVPGP